MIIVQRHLKLMLPLDVVVITNAFCFPPSFIRPNHWNEIIISKIVYRINSSGSTSSHCKKKTKDMILSFSSLIMFEIRQNRRNLLVPSRWNWLDCVFVWYCNWFSFMKTCGAVFPLFPLSIFFFNERLCKVYRRQKCEACNQGRRKLLGKTKHKP